MNKNIIKSVVVFSVAFGMVSLTLTEIITMDRYVLTFLYLLVAGVLAFYFFQDKYFRLVEKTKLYESMLIIGGSLLVHALVVYAVTHYASVPDWPFERFGASPLLMNNYYVWVKPLDIFVQHMFIVILVLRLHMYGLTLRSTTWLCIVGFGAIHIFQTLKTDVFVGLGFTAFAVVMAAVFPYLILRVRNGYLYNYALHLGLYSAVAIIAWFLF